MLVKLGFKLNDLFNWVIQHLDLYTWCLDGESGLKFGARGEFMKGVFG